MTNFDDMLSKQELQASKISSEKIKNIEVTGNSGGDLVPVILNEIMK